VFAGKKRMGQRGRRERDSLYFSTSCLFSFFIDCQRWYEMHVGGLFDLGPGRMAQTPQAGTDNSVSRFRRYHCSTVINSDSYFPVGEQFCIRLLLTTQILGLLQNIQNVRPLSTQCSLFPFSLPYGIYLYLRVSAQRFEPGGFIEPRRFRIILP